MARKKQNQQENFKDGMGKNYTNKTYVGRQKNEVSPKGWHLFSHLGDETVDTITGIIFLVLGVFFIMASVGHAGLVGEKLYAVFGYLLGVGYFLLPVISVILGISFLKSLHHNLATPKLIGAFVFLISGLGLIELLSVRLLAESKGGKIGHLIESPMTQLFAFEASFVILGALFIISLLIIFDTSLRMSLIGKFLSLFRKKQDPALVGTEADQALANSTNDIAKQVALAESKENEKAENSDEAKSKKMFGIFGKEDPEEFVPQEKNRKEFHGVYTPPSIDILEKDKGKPGVGDIKASANIIKRTLQNFGILVEMDEITIGPSVTRYALKPAEGVKLSRIVALQNDLSLALAAHPLRIEAPIPGKSLVGIEIPNTTKTLVGLGTLLSSSEFQQSDKPLLVSLGKGISGKSHFSNLAKMPHLLIAGTTGSGKSVTIHTIITSLLYRNSPEAMKLIMIDPKRVELTLYNKIPHLLTPVITEPKKSILALRWAAKEMSRRYDILEANSVRDIQSYHKNILEPSKNLKITGDVDQKKVDPMPYIVIIIDELADIMQTYPRELEAAIVRLAQMSRAVGIHLIVSTQRPSVNVITGLIKANIPARIALQVASQIDSRTILDMPGAEKLLGQGDMLYLSGEMSQPSRIQSAYISEEEVKNVVKYLVDQYRDEVSYELNLTPETASSERNPMFDGSDVSLSSDTESLDDANDDEMYEEARRTVMEAGKASTSFIQRKLRVGYARAARLVDMLEERGVIGPGDGARPREVLEKMQSTSEESQNL
jgi:DNA segregation ATPase FtsK/SpoIIIE, S-DNA-T family